MTSECGTIPTLRLLLAGLATGDSLGSTSEFIPQTQVPRLYEDWRRRGWPFRQVGGGSFGWDVGDPTDDTEMAWAMVASYIEKEFVFDPADIAERFVAWKASDPPDIGGTTQVALTNVQHGIPWHLGGRDMYDLTPRGAANGSLMRNGVIPAMAESLDRSFELTIKHGIITHYGPLPVLCCAIQTWLIGRAFQGRCPCARGGWLGEFTRDWSNFLDGCSDSVVRRWLDYVARPGSGAYDSAWDLLEQATFAPEEIDPFAMSYDGREGYCLLTLQIAVWAAAVSELEGPLPTPEGFPAEPFDVPAGEIAGWRAIAWIALIGHDSDTYGAAAGPLLAAMHGEPPVAMTEGLKVLDRFDRLAEQWRLE